MQKTALAAGLFSLALVVSACGSSGDGKTTESSASSAHTSASSTTSSVSETSPNRSADETAPARTTHPHASKPAAQPEQDDDPGGHPCTDQSGAPGHLVPSTGTGNHWICEITGDAPRN